MRKFFDLVLREPVLLALVLLTAGGVWVFVELAEAVTEGSSRDIDEWMILAMRNANDKADPVGPHWFEEMMRDFTALGGYGILTVLSISVVIYLWIRNQHQMAILVLFAVIGGVILSQVLKSVYDRPRPDLVPHGTIVYSRSFPSGHAMMSATTYLTLGAILAESERKRQPKVFFLVVGLVLTTIVGISRVYLGVHWPTDVLGGWAAGGAWALGCWSIAHIIDSRKKASIAIEANSTAN